MTNSAREMLSNVINKAIEEMPNTRYAPIGEISSGTMRIQDLLETFSQELVHAMSTYKWQGMTDKRESWADYINLVIEAQKHMKSDDETEQGQEIVQELSNALNDFAPPYVYFGSHQGDNAAYGFWPEVELAVEEGENSGYRVEVNDHGNVTLYDADYQEIWAVV